MEFIQNLKKKRRIKRVTKLLRKPPDFSNLYKVDSISEKEMALNALYEICNTDFRTKDVLNIRNGSKEKVVNIYDKLVLAGLGQSIKGKYIPVASLTNPYTLKFLLEHYSDGSFSIKDYDDYESTLFISKRLIQYFEREEVSFVWYK